MSVTNSCFFIGRTTKDIELRYTQNQKAVAKLSLAVNTGFGDNKQSNFFNLTAWGNTAEAISKYVTKGKKIAVECEATQNQYKDKNGNNVNTVDFRVLSFEFADGKSENTGFNQPQAAQQPQYTQSSIGDGFMSIPDGLDQDQLPFN